MNCKIIHLFRLLVARLQVQSKSKRAGVVSSNCCHIFLPHKWTSPHSLCVTKTFASFFFFLTGEAVHLHWFQDLRQSHAKPEERECQSVHCICAQVSYGAVQLDCNIYLLGEGLSLSIIHWFRTELQSTRKVPTGNSYFCNKILHRSNVTYRKYLKT